MRSQRHSFFSLFSFVLFFFLYQTGFSQVNGGNDTTYYVYFPGSITTRFYFSQKYTRFTIKGNGVTNLKYLPNTTLNMGVGATYHNFSLNLAYGFPFLNQDDNKGDTKYLDLQGHFYKPKTVVDFYGQLYKGYHLADGYAAKRGDAYYYRPDAKIDLFGLSVYRVVNDKRFSYRAALIQNEWQKKSAGTLLLGAEAYYGIIKADSSWVPSVLSNKYAQKDLTKIQYFSIGPGVGYAYTLVFFQHGFVTGSATANLDLTSTTENYESSQSNHLSLETVARFRLAAGYNGRVWNVSANWVWDDHPFRGETTENKYELQTGNYRLILARRLFPGPRLKKPLRIPDAIFKE